ncbi:hypothetical protein LTR28_010334 [Elasticomyces elasticus]|nr:hypothetical protein LTR28_010334 [Elasticomyces elasticus]
MSGRPVSFAEHPPHGHPENRGPSTQKSDKASTASHPPPTKPDPTLNTQSTSTADTQATLLSAFAPPSAPGDQRNATEGGKSATSAARAPELSSLKVRLQRALRQFPDFPSPGVLFEDILPIFADPRLHSDLIHALEVHVLQTFGEEDKPDVIVGLESRGFLFGPSLALRLGAGFVPVRKKGKLPGPTVEAKYEKEYGEDWFQMQADGISKGQKVLVVDDLIATGGSAAASGSLIRQLGGKLLGYVFIMELDFLKGREKLDAPVYTLLTGQEGKASEASAETQKQGDAQEMPLGRTKENSGEAKSVQDAGGAAAEQRP